MREELYAKIEERGGKDYERPRRCKDSYIFCVYTDTHKIFLHMSETKEMFFKSIKHVIKMLNLIGKNE